MPTVADYAVQLQRTFRYPLHRLTQRYVWKNDAIRLAMAGLEIGQLIRITNTALGVSAGYLDEWWYVASIEHTLAVGQTPETVVGLIPSYAYRNLDAILWDGFDRSNATGDLGKTPNGSAWANDGNFNIASNKAAPNATAIQLPNLALTVANCVVEVSLAALAAGAIEGVLYRHADASNYWTARVDYTSAQVQLRKVVAGVGSTVTTAAWTAAATAQIRAMVQGNRHRVWVDGVRKIDYTDAALNTNTRVGMYTEGLVGPTFDDWYSQAL